MTEIKINGRQMDLPEKMSIKLNRVNPWLKSSEDYTLDVPLPATANNMSVLGYINRMDVSKKNLQNKKMTCSLVAGLLRIEGSAVVTSITNEEIKIQILGGKSELKLKSLDDKGFPIYIDDVPLPGAYETEFHNLYGGKKEYNMKNLLDMFIKLPTMFFNPDKYLDGKSDVTNCVCFPIYSEADSAYANQHACHIFKESEKHQRFIWRSLLLADANKYPPLASVFYYPENNILAPQPYFCYVVEELFKALGYTVVENFIRTSWMRDIFIANARGVLHFNMLLPHWTLEEFIKEVEQTFGVRVLLRPGNKIHIVDRNRDDQNTVAVIEDIVDEFSVDVEEKDNSDLITEGNVGYQHPDDLGYMVLTEDILQRAKRVYFDTYEAMHEYYYNLTPEEQKKSDTLYIVGEDMYASINPGDRGWKPWQVNMMAAKKRQEYEETDIELRIVPVREMLDKYPVKEYENIINDDYALKRRGEERYTVPVTSDTRAQDNYLEFSINDAIKGETKERNKRDIIEVAYNPGMKQPIYNPWNQLEKLCDIPMMAGMPFYKDDNGAYLPTGFDYFSLRSQKAESISTRLDAGAKADTSIKLCVSFVSDNILKPDTFFLIRNKKYVCEKIELTITEEGVSPLKKGYFYEAL